MLFPTLGFALFFLLVYPICWGLRGRPRAWRWSMLAASYVFYGWWDWRFIGLLASSSLVNHWIACEMDGRGPRARKVWLGLGVGFNLGLLGTFKYYGLLAGSANGMARWLGLDLRLPLMEILLPVGISFFTFQALSYLVDLYRGQVEVVSWLELALFLAFFPQLVAGPIVRASEFLPQLRAKRTGERSLLPADSGRAAWLIGRGFFKKVVVSSAMAGLVDPVFASPESHNAPEIWLAVYAYAVQIYADFSGYTDMAIGIALLLGFRFPQNFDRPYGAGSIRDFWRRWHISLSRWLRDYLYIPLGGSRRGPRRTYLNLMATMALGGLWHGAAGHFLAWGLWQGGGLAVERWARQAVGGSMRDGRIGRATRRSPLRAQAGSIGGRLATFHFVCVGWLLFRAASVSDALILVRRAITAWEPAALLSLQASAGALALILGMLAVQQLSGGWERRLLARFQTWPLAFQGAALGLWLFLGGALSPKGVAPFIYFQF